MGCHALLQRIFPTQGSNPGLPYWRQTLSHLSSQGSPLDNSFLCVCNSVDGNCAFQTGGRTGSKSHRNPASWFPGTYCICCQEHCLPPEIRTQSRLSVFQAKCQESSYRSPRGLEAGHSQPHRVGCTCLGPGFQKAGEEWTRKGRSDGCLQCQGVMWPQLCRQRAEEHTVT